MEGRSGGEPAVRVVHKIDERLGPFDFRLGAGRCVRGWVTGGWRRCRRALESFAGTDSGAFRGGGKSECVGRQDDAVVSAGSDYRDGSGADDRGGLSAVDQYSDEGGSGVAGGAASVAQSGDCDEGRHYGFVRMDYRFDDENSGGRGEWIGVSVLACVSGRGDCADYLLC